MTGVVFKRQCAAHEHDRLLLPKYKAVYTLVRCFRPYFPVLHVKNSKFTWNIALGGIVAQQNPVRGRSKNEVIECLETLFTTIMVPSGKDYFSPEDTTNCIAKWNSKFGWPNTLVAHSESITEVVRCSNPVPVSIITLHSSISFASVA